jgi:hypothetical protein
MADQININCFKDLTIDGQLYEILSAINDMQITVPEGGQIAQVQGGELQNVELIDGGEFTP